MTREAAAIRVYTQRLKAAGKYAHVTSTRILKPASDRAYFYLIYATRHRKGVQEFRAVEKTAVAVQERLRNDVKYQAAVSRTGQPSLFGASMQGAVASYEEERKAQLDQALATLVGLLKSRPRGIKFEDSIGPVLETLLTWESDLKQWLQDLRSERKIDVTGMKPREADTEVWSLNRAVGGSLDVISRSPSRVTVEQSRVKLSVQSALPQVSRVQATSVGKTFHASSMSRVVRRLGFSRQKARPSNPKKVPDGGL